MPSLAARILIGGICCLGAAPAGAGEPERSGQQWLSELRAGGMAHDVDDLWSGQRRESGIDWNAEAIFLRRALPLPLPFGALRPNLGVSVNDHGDTSKLYAGLMWQIDTPLGLFLDLAGGGAIHDGKLDSRRQDRKDLGSRVLFRVAIDVGYAFSAHHRLMASFDHISNAYLAHPNEGLDTLGARYGYRF